MSETERILDKIEQLDDKITALTITVGKSNGVVGRVNSLEDKLNEHCTEAKTEKKVLEKLAKKGGNRYSYIMLGIMAFISLVALTVSIRGNL